MTVWDLLDSAECELSVALVFLLSELEDVFDLEDVELADSLLDSEPPTDSVSSTE